MSLPGADGAGPDVDGAHPLPSPRGAPESVDPTNGVDLAVLPPAAPTTPTAPTAPAPAAGAPAAAAPAPTLPTVPAAPAVPAHAPIGPPPALPPVTAAPTAPAGGPGDPADRLDEPDQVDPSAPTALLPAGWRTRALPPRPEPAGQPRRRVTREARRTLVVVGVQVLGLLLAALAFAAESGGTVRRGLLVDAGAMVLGGTAALFALAARRALPRQTAAVGWGCLALATVTALVGHVGDTVAGKAGPGGSLTGLAGTVGWTVLCCAGIWMLAGDRAAQWRHRRFDGLSIAFGTMGAGLAVLAATAGADGPPLGTRLGVVALAAVVTLTVTTTAVALMPSPGPRWLAGGVALIAAADLLAAAGPGHVGQGLAVLARLGGFAVCGLAALPVEISLGPAGSRERRAGAGLSSGIVLQTLVLLGAVLVLLLAVLGVPVSRVAAVLALTAVLLGLPRATLLVREAAGPLLPLTRPARSRTDDLTGLANRKAVSEALSGDLARSPEAGGWPGWPDRISLLLVDLDRFKEVNDALGHELGDRLLTEVGVRIGSVLRPSQMLARLGGDEFVVVLPGVAVEPAEQTARVVQGCLRDPFVLDGNRLHVRASVGIASCRLHDDQPADLLRQADVAMDDAKKSATGIAVYDPRQDRNSAHRLRRIDELRRALERGDLEVHLQPQVDLRTGALIGAEALARWRHPQDGVLLPDSFLPLAAQTGLMGPVAALVLDRALAACATWWLQGYYLPVGVNLTADDLRDPDLPALVTASLRKHLLPPSALRVEITEEALLHDAPATASLLDRWRADGVRVAIDDYGTGYSSLAYLRELPVDEIKLDRAFAHDLHRRTTVTIVRHTVAMAHGLQLMVVAEGVEDAATARLLADLGCDIGQGIYFGAAMTAEDFCALLARR